MAGWLDNPLLSLLEKGLDASSVRQKALANNIANVDTPGFKRSDVNFAAVLGEVTGEQTQRLPLKMTSSQHLTGHGGVQGIEVQTDQGTTMRNDDNNVDIDREMANVAENNLYYSGVSRAISSHLQHLRMVIQQK